MRLLAPAHIKRSGDEFGEQHGITPSASAHATRRIPWRLLECVALCTRGHWARGQMVTTGYDLAPGGEGAEAGGRAGGRRGGSGRAAYRRRTSATSLSGA